MHPPQKREYGPRNTGPKLPKMPALQDFQFFNTARLTQLYEKDNTYEVHKHSQAQVRCQPAAPLRLRSEGGSG